MSQRSGAIVRKAAESIKEQGWIQGVDVDEGSGSMCIRGAISGIEFLEYDSSNEWFNSLEEFANWMDSIGQLDEVRQHNCLAALVDADDLVLGWNDMPDRTKEEVLLYMNKFADEVDPQGP